MLINGQMFACMHEVYTTVYGIVHVHTCSVVSPGHCKSTCSAYKLYTVVW